MSFEDVMTHYGFVPECTIPNCPSLTEWIHPTHRDSRKRNCSVMILAGRAVVHCNLGRPIYAVSPQDVEFLLRREFECFACMPQVIAA